jgi:hypothetical protein
MPILVAAILLQVAAPSPPPAFKPPVSMPAGTSTIEVPYVKQTRYCRDMMNSSSRLGAFRVCKTRAAWQRWERCHSATRYCAPIKTAALQDNEDLVCKYLKVTGSRIAQEKICASRRQWYVMEQETQTTIRDRQNQSKIIRGGGGE